MPEVNTETFLNELKKKPSAKKTKTKKEQFFVPGFIPNQPVADKTCEGSIGIEIEVEGRNLPRGTVIQDRSMAEATEAVWNTHEDGSLRGESAEYVLSQPITIEELEPSVQKLWDHLSREGTTLRPSNRTSTHVHINVQGMTFNTLTSYLMLWTIFEQALINICGEDRKNNHFCLSSKELGDWLLETWKNALQKGAFNWTDRHKYSALNLSALSKFGSFEFRCMRTIESVNQIVDWCKVLYGLRELAKSNMFKNPADIPLRLSEVGAYEILRGLCQDYEISDEFLNSVMDNYEDDFEFNQQCVRNFRTIQPIITLFDWKDWEEEFAAKYVPNPFKKTTMLRNPITGEVRPARRVRHTEIWDADDI